MCKSPQPYTSNSKLNKVKYKQKIEVKNVKFQYEDREIS